MNAKNKKLLKLGRETVRSLSTVEMRMVGGGDSNVYTVVKQPDAELTTGTMSGIRTGSIIYSGGERTY
jgi:hypothetical protein